MTVKDVFECRLCGVCCQGDGGIFIPEDGAGACARYLGITVETFLEQYTEPRHGMLSLKTDGDGYCLFHDKERHICLIHEVKPRMCRDWPFFFGMLDSRQGFEDAREACLGISREVSWEDFLEYHREKIGEMPPRSYILKLNRKK